MENDIWNEISSFLNQLRCENINRESVRFENSHIGRCRRKWIS